MDCLVCHDGSGGYKKFPTGCGHPAYERKFFNSEIFEALDLGDTARHVGPTSRKTCGACHFYGGGGDGVKHGDLDSSLTAPDKLLDIHMDVAGLDYTCSQCHTSVSHDIVGRKHTIPAPGSRKSALPDDDGIRISCENCHTSTPHRNYQKLDDHVPKVACQTCHIPFIARGGVPTQTLWDWSTAGRFDNDHNMIVLKDDDGNIVYDTKKGTMGWGKDLIPEYAWYSGKMRYLLHSNTTDLPMPAMLNHPEGSYHDPRARIHPFKVHYGKQPYDPVNNRLVVLKLFGKKGTGAFWAEYDWVKAASAGMTDYGAPFSGSLDFVETAMFSPVNHMVAPAEYALECANCHSRNGRLSHLSGFYLAGRDFNKKVDTIGWLAVWFSCAGVFLHGVIRFIAKKIHSRKVKR